VAAQAPSELTRAGLGDLLAKASARVDWLAAHLLYGERYDSGVAERVLGPLRLACDSTSAVLAGEPGAIRELLRGLIESGIAMAIFGNSRPASGSEHHASHFWDLLAAQGRRAHASHGLQVGYATGFAMRLQRLAFGDCSGVVVPARPVPPAQPLGDDARAWLGDPTREILEAVQEKQRFIAEAGEGWPRDADAWDRVRAQLAPALGQFDAVAGALRLAGIPDVPGYLAVDEPTLRATFRFASRLRARWTTIDFLEGQGVLEQSIDAMLA
jgi:glycerol-1-phosphate dehydrogenase [NAD(P)+]